MKYPAKEKDLLNKVKECIKSGCYYDTRHATDRQHERLITRLEILKVLKTGFHEAKKDKFDDVHKAWNYAIRGRTLDKRYLRVIVSFDQDPMMIITAIDLK